MTTTATTTTPLLPPLPPFPALAPLTFAPPPMPPIPFVPPPMPEIALKPQPKSPPPPPMPQIQIVPAAVAAAATTDTFNYDISKYSTREIENLFRLPTNQSYRVNDVVDSANHLTSLIKSMNHPHIRRKLAFLEQAKDLLISHLHIDQNSTFQPAGTATAADAAPWIETSNSSFVNDAVSTIYDTTNFYSSILTTPTPQPRSLPPPIATSISSMQPQQHADAGVGGAGAGAAKDSLLPVSHSAEMVAPLYNKNNKTKKTSLVIDTRFRDDIYVNSSSDFQFTLPTKLKNVVAIKCSAFEFPVSFYGLSASYGNNYLNISIIYTDNNNAILSANEIFIIPDGNYTIDDLVYYINNTSFANATNTIFNNIQIYQDLTPNNSGSGKIYLDTNYVNNVGKISEIILDFTCDIDGNVDNHPLSTKLGWNLGFMMPYYSGAVSYTGETVPETMTIRYVYLAIDDFNTSVADNFITAFNTSQLIQKNIITRIPIKGSYFDLMIENDTSTFSHERRYFGPVEISKLKIQILDDHGRTLDMNNANYSFCLQITQIDDNV